MEINLRNEIKSYIVRSGLRCGRSLTSFPGIGWSDSVSNLSNKLQRGLCGMWRRFSLLDALGYDLVWQKRRDK